LEKKLNLVEKD